MGQEYTFALCLSHDVDRIYKTHQYLYQAIKQKSPRKLIGMFSAKNPYWTFQRTMDIEDRLGVKSSFNVLDEIHLSQRPESEWFTVDGWRMYAGRYSIEDPQVISMFRLLDSLGWEIGLHGS